MSSVTEALKTLQEECAKHLEPNGTHKCLDCELNGICGMGYTPCEWEIPNEEK